MTRKLATGCRVVIEPTAPKVHRDFIAREGTVTKREGRYCIVQFDGWHHEGVYTRGNPSIRIAARYLHVVQMAAPKANEVLD